MQEMNYILYDGNTRRNLLPLTFTRPVAEIRIGILTIRQKWERLLQTTVSWFTEPYLREKYPFRSAGENILINASVLPGKDLAAAVGRLKPGQSIQQQGILLAAWLDEQQLRHLSEHPAGSEGPAGQGESIEWTAPLIRINHSEDIFRFNGDALLADFELITRKRRSATPSGTNRVLGEALFMEEGVQLECANINTRTGPVYLGKDAIVMEGANLRGPLAICEGAVVKMGARLYGPTTIGPRCTVGGEIKQSVIFGHSNKGHDGYLGNSVVGEWCNFGADTNCSNMKNNYKPVRLWNYQTAAMRDTGLSYCGLIMGDFSRTGINSMFHTGTTVGVNVNVFGSAVPPAFVPDFSWGGGDAPEVYLLEKALEAAEQIKIQKGEVFTPEDRAIHEALFEQTRPYREVALKTGAESKQ